MKPKYKILLDIKETIIEFVWMKINVFSFMYCVLLVYTYFERILNIFYTVRIMRKLIFVVNV